MADFCDADGARKLKAKIEEYWALQGLVVSVELVDVPFTPQMRSVRTDIRSNMVNGMPACKATATVPKETKPSAPFAIRERNTRPDFYWVR
jgi:hypothetical protein